MTLFFMSNVFSKIRVKCLKLAQKRGINCLPRVTNLCRLNVFSHFVRPGNGKHTLFIKDRSNESGNVYMHNPSSHFGIFLSTRSDLTMLFI